MKQYTNRLSRNASSLKLFADKIANLHCLSVYIAFGHTTNAANQFPLHNTAKFSTGSWGMQLVIHCIASITVYGCGRWSLKLFHIFRLFAIAANAWASSRFQGRIITSFMRSDWSFKVF